MPFDKQSKPRSCFERDFPPPSRLLAFVCVCFFSREPFSSALNSHSRNQAGAQGCIMAGSALLVSSGALRIVLKAPRLRIPSVVVSW